MIDNTTLIRMFTNKMTSLFYFFKCVSGIFLLLCLSISYAQTIEATALQKRLTDSASIALTGLEIAKLQRFYSARNFQPVWMTAEEKPSQLETALAFIASADAEGLDSRDYQLQHIQQLQRQVKETENAAIELELRTTQALLTLTHDLSRGRLLASAADPDWYIPQQSFDAVAFLLKAIAGDNLTQSLSNLAPKKPSYQLLKKTLARYREFASRQATWLHIPNTPLIRPGTAHGVVPLIRIRMTQAYVLDGVSEYNVSLSNSHYYDDELVTAIKAFQAQHGLNADGIIGKNTLKALNTTLEWKIHQLRINMERLRWLPRDLGERYLLVNLAGFWLAAAEQGEHVLNMRIIVGRDYRSTPSFSSHVSHMILNPYWNIPASIARKDMLPKQQKDPGFFAAANIKVYSSYNYKAEALDPAMIDWMEIKKGFPYILRQDPGKNNALGTIKFMFSNSFNIYLHDTPSKALFQKDIRTFSSGCIRLESPLELAAFSLNEPTVSTEFADALASGETITMHLPQLLPIYLVYMTTWVDDLNKVHFSPDTYGRDSRALRYAGW